MGVDVGDVFVEEGKGQSVRGMAERAVATGGRGIGQEAIPVVTDGLEVHDAELSWVFEEVLVIGGLGGYVTISQAIAVFTAAS